MSISEIPISRTLSFMKLPVIPTNFRFSSSVKRCYFTPDFSKFSGFHALLTQSSSRFVFNFYGSIFSSRTKMEWWRWWSAGPNSLVIKKFELFESVKVHVQFIKLVDSTPGPLPWLCRSYQAPVTQLSRNHVSSKPLRFKEVCCDISNKIIWVCITSHAISIVMQNWACSTEINWLHNHVPRYLVFTPSRFDWSHNYALMETTCHVTKVERGCGLKWRCD